MSEPGPPKVGSPGLSGTTWSLVVRPGRVAAWPKSKTLAQALGQAWGSCSAVKANAHAAKRSKPVRSMLTSAVSSREARSLQQHDARLTPREPRQHCTVLDFSSVYLPNASSRSGKAFLCRELLFSRGKDGHCTNGKKSKINKEPL